MTLPLVKVYEQLLFWVVVEVSPAGTIGGI